MVDEIVICPCCKKEGFAGPDFERLAFKGFNGSSTLVFKCRLCKVIFGRD